MDDLLIMAFLTFKFPFYPANLNNDNIVDVRMCQFTNYAMCV
jgi:hypothetical protein